MDKPLWSDKTIDDCFSDDDELHYVTRMRDEYEAIIAKKDAKIAEQGRVMSAMTDQLFIDARKITSLEVELAQAKIDLEYYMRLASESGT